MTPTVAYHRNIWTMVGKRTTGEKYFATWQNWQHFF